MEFATTFTDYTLGYIIPFYGFIKLGAVVFLGPLKGASLVFPMLEPYFLKADEVAKKYEAR